MTVVTREERVTQYSRGFRDQSRGRSVLDTPLSRGMTAWICAAIYPPNSLDRDARHSVHKVRSRDVGCGTKGSTVGTRHPRQIAADQRQRQEHRPHLRRHMCEQLERRLEMLSASPAN